MINVYAVKYKELQMQLLEEVLSKKVKKLEAARRLKVSRVTLDKWLNRYQRFGADGLVKQKRKQKRSAPNRTPKNIEDEVICLAKEYWFDGVEILSDRYFALSGKRLHPSTIYRILQRRKERYTDDYSQTQKKHKKQLYAHKEAGLELQMDTKYPFGYKVGKVVYTVIDDATRWSYAKVYETANATNTVDFIRTLKQRAPFDIQKIRTDCGTEFVNYKVTNHLEEQNIEHRKNTPYCPEENGKIERFHRTLNEKAIQIFWSPQDSTEVLQYKLRLFLDWYNYEKRHSGLGMNRLTPFQKLLQLKQNQNQNQNVNVNLTLQCNKN